MPKFHITLDTPLALHGVGKTSGLIVNVGEGVTSVAAIYEGRSMFKKRTNGPVAHLRNLFIVSLKIR